MTKSEPVHTSKHLPSSLQQKLIREQELVAEIGTIEMTILNLRAIYKRDRLDVEQLSYKNTIRDLENLCKQKRCDITKLFPRYLRIGQGG